MKINGINIRFSVAVLFELAKLKGYTTLDDFKDFNRLTPAELLETIRLCMISGERAEGRSFDISTDELAQLLTPRDLADIVTYITAQSQGAPAEEENKKKPKRRRLFRFFNSGG